MKQTFTVLLVSCILLVPANLYGQERQKIDRTQRTASTVKENTKQSSPKTSSTKTTSQSKIVQRYLLVDGSSSSRNRSLGASASSYYFDVSCSGSYSVGNLPDWCYVSEKSRSGFWLKYVDNNSAVSRVGSFEVTGAGRSVRINLTQAGRQDLRKVAIGGVSVVHHEMVDGKDGLSIRANMSIKGMKDKEVRVVAYFYDSDGNALKDTNGRYRTTNSDVCTGISINPTTDNYSADVVTLSIPYEELHLSATGDVVLKYDIGVFDMTQSTPTQVFSSTMFTTTISQHSQLLKLNGGTQDLVVTFSSSAGSEFFRVSAPNGSFEMWGVPSWCSVTRSSNGFTLYCNANHSTSERSDLMKILAGGETIRLSIKQRGAAYSSYTTSSVSSYRPSYRRPFFSWRNGISIGYIQKQWAYKQDDIVEKSGMWDNSKYMSGIQVGYRGELMSKIGLGLATGLFYEYYFTKTDELYLDEGIFNGKVTEHSLYVPVHLKLALPYRRSQIFAYGGLGLDYGLGGKFKITDPSGYYEDFESSDLYDDSDLFNSWKHFNMSVEYGAGVRYWPIQLQVQMSKGLKDMSDDSSWKTFLNKNFNLSLSIMF